jgi:hypothetical protein
MARHPYKQEARAKREARMLTERQAREAFERRCELAPLARSARKVDTATATGRALLAAFEREGV